MILTLLQYSLLREQGRLDTVITTTQHNDRTLIPIKSNCELLHEVIKDVLLFCDGEEIDVYKVETRQLSTHPHNN